MIYNIYSIYDAVADTYMAPTIEPSDSVIQRNIENALWKKDSVLFTHADDFSVRCIGHFNDQTGEIVANEPYTCFNVASLKKE